MAVIDKDSYRVDRDSQKLLRALYHTYHDDGDKETADGDEDKAEVADRSWMSTSELADVIDADNTYRVRYRVQNHLEPAGLVRTVQTPRDDGGDGTYRYRITTYAMQWLDDEHPDIIRYPPDDHEEMSDRELAIRNSERIAALSDGEFSGQDIDTVLDRMDRLDRRMDTIGFRVKEIEELETRLSTVEDRLETVLGWDDSLVPVDQSEFDAVVEELAAELGRIEGITDREIGEVVRRIIDRRRN